MFSESHRKWLIIYDVKGQCAQCANVDKVHNMVACNQHRDAFGNAHNCPVFRYTWEDEK